MDGRNSSGRTVSLLNDTPADIEHHHLQHLSKIAPSVSGLRHQSLSESLSRSPSAPASTPGLSPQTPPLIRSESSDSRTTFASPSPTTPPNTSFEPQSKYQHQSAQQGYYLQAHRPWSKMDDSSLYSQGEAQSLPYSLPPIGSANGLPHDHNGPDSPVSDSRHSIVSTASAQNSKNQKKSQYPCPLAKQYKCSDFFTTSGHAARHAKKHTGRKDAICPECNKAFTRKDNMEQHRRTHQNHRGPSTKTSSTENRVKKPSKAGRRGEKGDVNGALEAAVSELDQAEAIHAPLSATDYLPANPAHQPVMHPATGGGPGPYYISPEPIASLPLPMPIDFGVRPPLYRTNYSSQLDFTTTAITPSLGDPIDLHFNYPSPGLSNGLNTLALVASDHRRMSEEAASSVPKSASTTP